MLQNMLSIQNTLVAFSTRSRLGNISFLFFAFLKHFHEQEITFLYQFEQIECRSLYIDIHMNDFVFTFFTQKMKMLATFVTTFNQNGSYFFIFLTNQLCWIFVLVQIDREMVVIIPIATFTPEKIPTKAFNS